MFPTLFFPFSMYQILHLRCQQKDGVVYLFKDIYEIVPITFLFYGALPQKIPHPSPFGMSTFAAFVTFHNKLYGVVTEHFKSPHDRAIQ